MPHSLVQASADEPIPASRPMSKPVVRKLEKDDIFNSLIAGWKDVKAAPRFGLVIGALHVCCGWFAIYLSQFTGMKHFAYPLLTGVALVSPFSAAALYEVSRRLEKGEELSWTAVLRSVKASGGRDLGWMCLVALFGFILWIDFSFFLYLIFYGAHMPDTPTFLREVLTTEKGLAFLLVGNIFGFGVAFVVFSISVVSTPLLLDRDVDFVTAMITSVKSVLANPWPLLAWAFTIAAMLAFGLLSGMLGLILVLPLLGHASWHVYRKLVEPEAPAAP